MPFPALGAILAQLGRAAAAAATDAAVTAAARTATTAATGAAEAGAARVGAQAASKAASGPSPIIQRLAAWQAQTGAAPTGKAVTGSLGGPAHVGPPTAVAPPGGPVRPPPVNTSVPNPGGGPSKPPVAPSPGNPAAGRIAEQLFQMGKNTISQGLGTTTGDAISSMLGRGGGGGGGGQQPPGGGLAGYLGAGPRGQYMMGQMAGAAKGVAKIADPLGVVGSAGKMAHGLMRVNPAIAAAEDLAKALVKLPALLEGWGDELMAGRRHLVAFSGSIAEAFGEAERRDAMRNIKSGSATGGTTQQLSRALDDFKDNMQPLKDAATNVMNFLATGLLQIANGFADILEKWKVIEDAAAWMKKAFPEQPRDPAMLNFINRMKNPPPPNVPPKV